LGNPRDDNPIGVVGSCGENDELIRGSVEVISTAGSRAPVLNVAAYPWLSVCGFGTHIKSTQKHLIIQKKKGTEYYPIGDVKNLLVVGGHTISSTTVVQLVKQGAYITFFEPDGIPVGTIKPYNDRTDADTAEYQRAAPRQRYAIAIAQASIKSRLFAIERIQEQLNCPLFYEGELELLRNAQNELEYLIKLDEIRRLHRLTSDMYYEIMARQIPPELGFRRRTVRPQTDPVNAMLSFGYAMLFGNCYVAVVGARLDPDLGLMQEGTAALVHDLIEPLKTEMIDSIVFSVARESLASSDYELTHDRCMLSDELAGSMITMFHASINAEKIGEQVHNFYDSLKNNHDLNILN
jgi:CRISPR-associated protein Cas1